MRRKFRSIIKNRILSCLLMISMLCVSLSACGEIKEEKKAEGQAGLSEITMALDWMPNTNHTGLYVAKAKGYFKEAGLDVTIVLPTEDGATDMVVKGQAEFGIAFQREMAEDLADNPKLNVTAVAAVYQHNQDGLLSLTAKDIDTPVKLMDQSYATAENVIEQEIVHTVVELDGGDFTRVQLVPTYVENAEETLYDAGISAVWGSYGWEGVSCLLANHTINFIPFASRSEAFDYYNVLIIGNNSFLKGKPDVAKKFIKAVSRGYEYAVSDPAGAAQILLEEEPDLNAGQVKASQEYVSGQYIADASQFGIIDADRWNRFFAWINEKKVLKNQVPEDTGFSNEFLPDGPSGDWSPMARPTSSSTVTLPGIKPSSDTDALQDGQPSGISDASPGKKPSSGSNSSPKKKSGTGSGTSSGKKPGSGFGKKPSGNQPEPEEDMDASSEDEIPASGFGDD